ncbi:MAG: hypothetical protein AAF841_07445 [Pseudomonadota bacterium]
MNMQTHAYGSEALAPLTDFTWAELADDPRQTFPRGQITGNIIHDAECPAYLAGGKTAAELASDGALREWLLSHCFDEVHIGAFEDAGFEAYRDLAMAVASTLPRATLSFDTALTEGLRARLAALFAQEHTPMRAKSPSPGRNCAEHQIERELSTCLANLRKPEKIDRIEARLSHIRRRAKVPTRAALTTLTEGVGHLEAKDALRKATRAANAIVPGHPGICAAGLNLGKGFVLSPWMPGSSRQDAQERQFGSPSLGYQLSRASLSEESSLPPSGLPLQTSVILDPRPGKALKHEPVHALFVSEDGEVRLATEAFRILGHGAQHCYLGASDESLLDKGIFCFNEAWQFLGMSTRVLASNAALPKPFTGALAILRTHALWNELVGRADIGCLAAADALRALEAGKRLHEKRARAVHGDTPLVGNA